jgi:hypothetical protein
LVLLAALDRQVYDRTLWTREYRAVLDGFTHAIDAAFLFLPCAILNRRAAGYVIVAAVVGAGLDIDHFIVAGSLDIYDATHLEARPPTHSLTFAVLLGIAVLCVLRSRSWAVVVALAIISHVLRDASGSRTHLFYPFPPMVRVPTWFYYTAEAALVFVGSYAIWTITRAISRTN